MNLKKQASGSNQIPKTVVRKWDVKDRGDGLEIRAQFSDGTRDKQNWSDEEARELAETILRVTETDVEERPVTEGTNVR